MGKLFVETKVFNLIFFVFNFFLLNVWFCVLKKFKKLGELLNVMYMCREKKSFIFEEIDNYIG